MEQVQSSSSDQVRGSEKSGNLLLCSFKMEGRRKKMNQNESSPIQLGEGTSTLRQGFIQEGLSPSLDERKSHSSSACVMHLVVCTDVFASLCMQQVNWKVCLSYIYDQHSCPSHLLQERWHFSFLIPSFLSFSFFSQYQSKTT